MQGGEIGGQRQRAIERRQRIRQPPGLAQHRRKIAPGFRQTGLCLGRAQERLGRNSNLSRSIQRETDADERTGMTRIAPHGLEVMGKRQRQIAGHFGRAGKREPS